MARNDNWTTPIKLYCWLHSRFNFNVDAAASPENTKCKRFFSIDNSFLNGDINALERTLGRGPRVFMNPPYSMAKEFTEQAVRLNTLFSIPFYILLPQRCDRIWFQKLLHTIGVRDEPFTGRIHFGGASAGAFMYNVGVILGFKDIKTFPYVDAGQFNEGGKGSAQS